MNQPTELQRARWWRDGWGKAYNLARATDKMTVRIERREWRAVVRWVKACRAGRAERKLNASREATSCQGKSQGGGGSEKW
jgi:hypothetical protein